MSTAKDEDLSRRGDKGVCSFHGNFRCNIGSEQSMPCLPNFNPEYIFSRVQSIRKLLESPPVYNMHCLHVLSVFIRQILKSFHNAGIQTLPTALYVSNVEKRTIFPYCDYLRGKYFRYSMISLAAKYNENNFVPKSPSPTSTCNFFTSIFAMD